jgi:ATP-dependent DNA helicase DinG
VEIKDVPIKADSISAKATGMVQEEKIHSMEDLLGQEGALAELVPNFVYREVQVQLANTISSTINEGKNALLEAGTGTGKTFAYLLPLISSGKKGIVSTGTKTLQDQLFRKDLPLILRLFNKRYKVSLLKGRANYVCPERLDKHIKVIADGGTGDVLSTLVKVREWTTITRTGDLTEYSDFGDNPALVSMFTSTRDNCLGSKCPKYSECPLYRARAKANDADLVVINHHLLFADLALREDSLVQLLPEVDCIIVDEAHQVPEIARQFFGSRISSGQIYELARDVKQELQLLGNDDPELLKRINMMEHAVGKMAASVKAAGDIQDLASWLVYQGAEFVEAVDISLGDVLECLSISEARSSGLKHNFQRANRLMDQFAMLTEPGALEEDYVHWIQQQPRGFVVHLSSLSISDDLAAHFNQKNTAWIFTSATLNVSGNFDHFRHELGLIDAKEEQFDSPFDYETQVLAYVPSEIPLPGTDEHTQTLIQKIEPFLRMSLTGEGLTAHGKALFLFTSHRALKLAADLLTTESEFVIFFQGQLPKTELLQRFRETPGSILLATQSFWEGVDLRGAGLNCLIIDKLPFSSPDDPLSRALMRAVSLTGGNGFMEYLLPQAVISLKQGFGRLIRQEDDQGLFILGDSRVLSKAYGKLIVKSLPAMRWTTEDEEAVSFLQSVLNRAETISETNRPRETT